MFYVKDKLSDGCYCIADNKDNSVDVCTRDEIRGFINLGISIKGVSLINNKLNISIYEKDLIPEDITKFDTDVQRALREKLLSGIRAYRFIAVTEEIVNRDRKGTVKYYDYHILENTKTGEHIIVDSSSLVMLFVKKVLKVDFKAERCSVSYTHNKEGVKVVGLPVISLDTPIYAECHNYLTRASDLSAFKPTHYVKQGISIKNCRVRYIESIDTREGAYFDTESLVNSVSKGV